jgi:ABC-type bacteriocin/lantibiotic exporter with double-glycine peptidase domain
MHILGMVLFGTLVLGYLIFLLIQDFTFGLLALGLGLAQIAVLYGTMRRVNYLSQSDVAAQTETQGYLVEALSGMETIKASGAEQRALSVWNRFFLRAVDTSLRRNHLVAVVDAMMGALRAFSPLLLTHWVRCWPRTVSHSLFCRGWERLWPVVSNSSRRRRSSIA